MGVGPGGRGALRWGEGQAADGTTNLAEGFWGLAESDPSTLVGASPDVPYPLPLDDTIGSATKRQLDKSATQTVQASQHLIEQMEYDAPTRQLFVLYTTGNVQNSVQNQTATGQPGEFENVAAYNVEVGGKVDTPAEWHTQLQSCIGPTQGAWVGRAGAEHIGERAVPPVRGASGWGWADQRRRRRFRPCRRGCAAGNCKGGLRLCGELRRDGDGAAGEPGDRLPVRSKERARVRVSLCRERQWVHRHRLLRGRCRHNQ